jgi:hypothetical protein
VRYGIDEIVQVLSVGVLINPTWRKCQYTTRDGQRLEPGYYLVLWPAPIIFPVYDQNARFFGPFPTRILAEKLRTSALSLGIITPDSSEPIQAGTRNDARKTQSGSLWLSEPEQRPVNPGSKSSSVCSNSGKLTSYAPSSMPNSGNTPKRQKRAHPAVIFPANRALDRETQ